MKTIPQKTSGSEETPQPRETKETPKKVKTRKASKKAAKTPKKAKVPKEPKAPKVPKKVKEPAPPLPTPEEILGKSAQELDVLWANILKSEAALDRSAPNFLEEYSKHYPLLRLINAERGKLKNP